MRALLIGLFIGSNAIFGQTELINKEIQSKINHNIENPVHSILLYIENEKNNFKYNEGFGLINKEKDIVTKQSSFKIASSTKLFIATIILQMQEESKLKIEDKVFTYIEDLKFLDFENFHKLEGENYAQDITIEHLLSHRSGLADIFTDREEAFFSMLINNPNKEYSPKSLVTLYFQFNLNQEPHFKPNGGWHYSDINYLLLGLLIEKIDDKKLAESIRSRILEPLKMDNTFFEYYETPKNTPKLINQYVGTIDFSTINTSFDWSGGGLVATNLDLAIYIKAIFNNKLINQESLTKMINVQFTKEHEIRYGLGIYEFNINGDIYYGHFGFYNTFVGYCPKTKSTLSYSISQTNTDFNTYNFISDVLKLAK